jgi:hypothetical protein
MNAYKKYTDRDVRTNSDFYTLVCDYLLQYEGGFEFLIDCKMRLEQNIDLSVGMVRGILNCMRVDPRVKSLPEPQVETFDADVIPMHEPHVSRGYRHNKRIQKSECNFNGPHLHNQEDFKYIHYCPGSYAINREPKYTLPAIIHSEYIFVKAKTSSSILIHRGLGAEVMWFPRRHEFGWERKPELIIHTNCKYPYYLRNPILMSIEDVKYNATLYDLLRCVRCFGVE